MDSVEKIAAAVLYEGYVLWPYRRSARKNQKRWTLGGVYPRHFSEAGGGHDPWLMQTQCLVLGEEPAVSVRVRFLHVVNRAIARTTSSGTRELVDELRIRGERYLAWEEAAEREIHAPSLGLAELHAPRQFPVAIPAGGEEETLRDGGAPVGAIVRSWATVQGTVEVGAEAVESGLFRLTIKISNDTPWHGQDRETVLKQTFVSTHAILNVEGGEFVSLLEPPEHLRRPAEACENVKTWPVLAGEDGDRHTMLSSPIILYDYPRTAPESPGDLFDGGEIDQLLMLNILTLTDEEKDEMRATDPRTRAILERTESLGTEDFMRLHGAIREFQVLRPADDEVPPFWALDQPGPERVTVDGAEIGRGSKVRLRPRPGGDIFDIALAGKVAFVEAIEQDYDGRVHLAVTLEDDPGRDLGQERQIGHRFFFALDEVEPLDARPPEQP